MMSDPLSTVYLIFLGLISFLIALFLVLNYRKSHGSVREKFTQIEDKDDYKARLKVIDIFDSYLKRNPTPKEISKYSQFENEQDIMAAVMKDFPQVASAKKGLKKEKSKKPHKKPVEKKKDKKSDDEEAFTIDNVEGEDEPEEESEEDDPNEAEEETDSEDQEETLKKDNTIRLSVGKDQVDRALSKIEQIKADVRDIELTFMHFLPSSSEKM